MRAALVVCVTAGLLGAGCSGPEDRRVTILAASSLSDVMPEMVARAQEVYPEEDYEVAYAGSAQIVQQLNAGALADLVVLAGPGPLAALDTDLEVNEQTTVATNTLTIALAPGNPGGIRTLEDLAGGDVTLVVCAEQVPCGAAAAQMFDKASITPRIASFEPDVRATLAKVTSGEADAGVVYVTDVTGSTEANAEVQTVAVPESAQVVTSYPALVIDGSENGRALVDFMTSPYGQAIWGDAGFGTPS